MHYQTNFTDELIVDNFAGGGGASCGIEMATQTPVHIAINHDQDAIAMHEINHPYTRHYCEDVWDIDPRAVTKGQSVGLAWFSPDCKHFSRAKGGKPVEKKIRGLAWVAIRWAATVKPRIIALENVEEFLTWGPLLEDGKPCPDRKGQTFMAFVSALKKQGYKVEWKSLRACDYGAPTIRKRLFLIARRDNKPIIWPKPTHGPAGSGLKPYRTAAECIDWSIPCPSIFGRKRPLAENTMKRIAKGLKRFVMDADDPFIAPTIDGVEIMCPSFLTEHANGSSQRVFDVSEPMRTQCAQVKGGHFALCTAFMAKHFGGMTGVEINKPLPTTTARGTQNQIVTAHIARHFGQSVGHDMDGPFGTLTGTNKDSVITSHLLKMRGSHSRDKHGQDAREPLHTISASGQHHAEVRAFLLKYYGNEKSGQALNAPIGTVTSRDRFGLVTIKGVDYQIIDIGMRMLTPRELYRAQGFPDDYIIDRVKGGRKLSKTAQIRMCGNSVSPPIAQAIMQTNYQSEFFGEQETSCAV